MPKVIHWWQRVPASIRKPIILVVGWLFIIAAAATGWLPGPGGIPLFLIGIAILATEFVWAERVRDIVLRILKDIPQWCRRHKFLTVLLTCGAILVFVAFGYFVRRMLK